jgi:diguanylate cyclase (GGDEF)-like protein
VIAHAAPVYAIVVAAALAAALTGCCAAWSWRAQALRDRLALRLGRQREAAFVEAARRLADAAGTSVVAVREEIERAVRVIAPGIDAVMFFEELDAELTCVAATGARVAYFDGLRFALDDESSLLVRALRSGHRMTGCDAPDTRPLHPGDAFAAAIPLVLDAGRRCVLYVGGDDGGLEAVADRIVSLVDQATPAYRIALERADDRARAAYDGLTGLLTARTFRTDLLRLVEQARCRPLGRLGLLFIDTDRFKSWNDTHGHASGDALLRELALLLRASANGPGDIAARNGGDEFCVVYADAEKSTAIQRAERLRANIAEADFHGLHAPVSSGEDVRISASIGIACFPVDAQSAEALLEKADEAMYHSKKTGRNGVSFFGVDSLLVRGDGAAKERSADRRRE